MPLRTPLDQTHRRLGARMVDFAGWEMPMQYPTGIIAEHLAVRGRCGLFDLSHMGRLVLRGPDALALAQACLTRDLARIRPGEAAYALLCAPDGGILDDLIGYLLAPDEVLLVANASNREKDSAWLREQQERRGQRASVHDRTLETALIGVQGPAAQGLLQPACSADLEPMAGYSFVRAAVAGCPALVSRTGYTGEDGFELLVDAEHAGAVWNALLDRQAGALACGLGARDTLRTEAGLALYGHEIDQTTNPYEARLAWVVNLGKAGFVGRDALAAIKERGASRKLVGLRLGAGGVPRPGFPLLHEGRRAGSVTSGTFSPTLQRSIALGYVPAALSAVGQPLAVEMRNRAVAAEVVGLPFVPHRARPRAKAA